MIFGGLTSRCVFVWGEKKEQLIAYPGDMVEDDEYRKREEDLTHDLQHISRLRGRIVLTPEAKEWGREWYKQHWTIRPEHLASDRFDGYRARKQTHMHKLAMVLSAAVRDDLTITKEILEVADAAVTGLEADMLKVFESIGASEMIKHVDAILALITRRKSITKQTLWRLSIRQMDERQFQDALNSVISAGYVKMQNVQGEIRISMRETSEPD